MAEDALSISLAAEKFGLSEDTLRYYEKIGLATSHRRPSGIRFYSPEDCARLEFVKCMRDAGVSLEALVTYMKLMAKGDKTIQERKELLVEQREELRKKKALIEHSLERLDYKIDHYEQLMAKGCPNKK
jgi:DNA-binding transcriptional MerR regulator